MANDGTPNDGGADSAAQHRDDKAADAAAANDGNGANHVNDESVARAAHVSHHTGSGRDAAASDAAASDAVPCGAVSSDAKASDAAEVGLDGSADRKCSGCGSVVPSEHDECQLPACRKALARPAPSAPLVENVRKKDESNANEDKSNVEQVSEEKKSNATEDKSNANEDGIDEDDMTAPVRATGTSADKVAHIDTAVSTVARTCCDWCRASSKDQFMMEPCCVLVNGGCRNVICPKCDMGLMESKRLADDGHVLCNAHSTCKCKAQS